jgi:hypothetical protein
LYSRAGTLLETVWRIQNVVSDDLGGLQGITLPTYHAQITEFEDHEWALLLVHVLRKGVYNRLETAISTLVMTQVDHVKTNGHAMGPG